MDPVLSSLSFPTRIATALTSSRNFPSFATIESSESKPELRQSYGGERFSRRSEAKKKTQKIKKIESQNSVKDPYVLGFDLDNLIEAWLGL